jgi:hypothetical protein
MTLLADPCTSLSTAAIPRLGRYHRGKWYARLEACTSPEVVDGRVTLGLDVWLLLHNGLWIDQICKFKGLRYSAERTRWCKPSIFRSVVKTTVNVSVRSPIEAMVDLVDATRSGCCPWRMAWTVLFFASCISCRSMRARFFIWSCFFFIIVCDSITWSHATRMRWKSSQSRQLGNVIDSLAVRKYDYRQKYRSRSNEYQQYYSDLQTRNLVISWSRDLVLRNLARSRVRFC